MHTAAEDHATESPLSNRTRQDRCENDLPRLRQVVGQTK